MNKRNQSKGLEAEGEAGRGGKAERTEGKERAWGEVKGTLVWVI